jgi:hypothetical protein
MSAIDRSLKMSSLNRPWSAGNMSEMGDTGTSIQMYSHASKMLGANGLTPQDGFGMPPAFVPGMTNLDYSRETAGKMDKWRLLLLGAVMLAASGSAEAQGIPRGIPIPKFPKVSPKQQPAIPPAYRPPQGMCRVWIEGVPPDQQPAPTDCVTAVRNRPANGSVIFGDDSPKKGYTKPKKGKSGRDPA